MTEPSEHPSDRLGSLISVVSFERQDLVTDLLTDADLNTFKHLARKGTPENSLRALTSDLAYFEAWCLTATDQALTWLASESLVLKYVAHHLYDAAERAEIRIIVCRLRLRGCSASAACCVLEDRRHQRLSGNACPGGPRYIAIVGRRDPLIHLVRTRLLKGLPKLPIGQEFKTALGGSALGDSS